MANYTPDYAGGDIAKAGQNTVAIGILEIGAYMGMIVLVVVIGFIAGYIKKARK